MKKTSILTALMILLMTGGLLSAQTPLRGKVAPVAAVSASTPHIQPILKFRDQFAGKWMLNGYDEATGTLTFQRPPREKFNWGSYLYFEGEQFAEGYSAPCGNDSNIHRNEGDWEYDFRTKVFRTSIPFYLTYTKAYVQERSADKLVLVVAR